MDPAAKAAAEAAAKARLEALLAARVKKSEDLLAKAAAFLAEGKINEAYQTFLLAAGDAVNDQTKQAALAFMKQLNDAASAQLADADKVFGAGNYAEATKSYRQIAVWSRLTAGRQAEVKLAEMAKDPRVRVALQDLDAAKLYETVETAVAAKRGGAAASPAGDAALVAGLDAATQAKVVERLEMIIKQFSATPTAAKAAPLLKALQADSKVMAAVKSYGATQQASQDYALAKMFRDSKLTDKALDAYEKVLKTYPGTEWAQKAAADLAVLKGK